MNTNEIKGNKNKEGMKNNLVKKEEKWKIIMKMKKRWKRKKK